MGLILQILTGLRFRLLLLVLLVCLPLAAIILYGAWEERRGQIAGWEQKVQKLVQVASREEQETIRATKQLLVALAESAAVNNGDLAGSRRLLDRLFAGYPRYANLGIVDTNGMVIASAVASANHTNVAQRAFFRRAVRSRTFAIGEYETVEGSRPAIRIGYPVLDDEGQLVSVVFAAIDLQYLSRFGSEIPGQVPAGASWSVVDQRGRVIGRHPRAEQWVGRNYPDTALLETALIERKGVFQPTDEVQPRVHGFATIPSNLAGGKAMCILSIPRKTLFAESDRLLRRNLTWLAAAGGLALLMGWLGSNLLIVRPVKTLVKTSSRLASGDLSARTGLRHGRDELGLLMASFDQMAQALEEREKGRLQAAKKLAALSHRLVEVQESERRSIARELHDEIGQSLTAAEMNLQLALRAPGGKQVAPRLRASIEAVEQVLAQVHDLSLSLRPSMLDDLGLEAALRWYSQRQAELAGFKAEFHPVPLERRLDPIIETECFRIAQEALNNVVRHAKAKCVAIRLAINDAELHLCVADDGAGFHVEELRAQAVRGASLGLLSMEERAVLAGGGFNLSSSPGRGTEIRAWFPLRWQGSERTFSTST